MTRVVGWPFSVSVGGDVTGGGPASIVVEWRNVPELQRETIDRVKCVGSWWVRLAAEGALGGDQIPPQVVDGALLDAPQPQEIPGRAQWQLSRLRVDPKSITILLNLFYQSELPITGVTITAVSADRQDVLTPRDYPARWPKPGFACADNRPDRNVAIEVTFGGDVAPEHKEPIADALRVWAMIGALGGFREVVALDAPSEIIPEDDPAYDIDLLSMTVRDRNVHEVAYDTLVNLLAAIGTKRIRIAEVELG